MLTSPITETIAAESGIISYKRLVCNLQPYGYAPVTPPRVLWTHLTLPTTFTLAVDDFGIKLFAADNATPLLDALRENYSITLDPSGSKYCGITINWNYPDNYVYISMPNSINKYLERFQHPVPTRPKHSPHKWIAPMYDAKVQYSSDTTPAPKLDKYGITSVQSISDTFIYISRAVEPTMLIALNKIGAEQASPTTSTIKKMKMLIDYAAKEPDAIIRFHASDMCVHINSNTAYIVQPLMRSRAAGHYYLSDNPPPPHIRRTSSPNVPILTKCQTIRTVMASATEDKTEAIFLNGQKAVPIRTALIEMGHLKPPTPIKTDNATSHGILTRNMRRKRYNAFDIRFHWIRCCIRQNQFCLY